MAGNYFDQQNLEKAIEVGEKALIKAKNDYDDDSHAFGLSATALGLYTKVNGDYKEAIDYYNGIQRRLLLEEALKRESRLVRKESMQVLKEFEETGNGD